MKTRQNLYLILIVLAHFISACQRENDKNPALLGKWQGTEWLIFDKPSGQDATRVHFEFREDGAYAAGFGDQSEKGVWRTVGDKLYTTAEGRKEIMVKVLGVNATKLKFEMNRGGQPETIELQKIQ
jgi:hypothetical protein